MYKADFHTHSILSPDGALTREDYRRMLEARRLDVIAISDHNTTDFARELQTEFGERIIVAEEITTLAGEVIGLYLSRTVPPLLSLEATVAAIKDQGGLVYVPHPFETVRKGLTLTALDSIASDVDILEGYNGRAYFQNKSPQALAWATQHAIPIAASSDSHGRSGWGRTYTSLAELPTRETLVALLAAARPTIGYPGARALMYPKFNRLRKKLRNAR